jgi:dUTP pyrophosphatase
MIAIKKLHPDAKLPEYAHPDDAGMDFYASESITLQPNERTAVPTGIALAIPSGFVGLLWDKSGMAVKHGLKTMAGVIDAGYRGEIKIILHNLSNQPYTFERGTKVAQMLIQPVHQKRLIEVEDLDSTNRGTGGFGSTGTH